MNEIVQTGFFDAEPPINNNARIAIISDWRVLSKDELRQETQVYHNKLEQQEQQCNAVIAFANEQKKNVICEKRDLYEFMKGQLTYEEWVTWLKSINVGVSTAYEYIKLGKEYHLELTSTRGRSVSRNQLREIHHSGEGHQILAKLNSGEVEATPQAIVDEIKAVKKRAEEAESQVTTKQQELFKLQSESHDTIIRLSQHIEDLQKQKDERQQKVDDLQQQIISLSTPEKEIVEKEVMPADYTEKQAEIKKLQAEKVKLIEQRDKLSALAKELGDDLDTLREASEAKREREMQEARILQNWREVTGTFHKQVLKLLTQFPTPIDTQIFESEDWERLSQTENVARRFLAECEMLSNRSTSMVIDAG